MPISGVNKQNDLQVLTLWNIQSN